MQGFVKNGDGGLGFCQVYSVTFKSFCCSKQPGMYQRNGSCKQHRLDSCTLVRKHTRQCRVVLVLQFRPNAHRTIQRLLHLFDHLLKHVSPLVNINPGKCESVCGRSGTR
ncbi:hypothetical protein M433DRAFT_182620 [Acidomyces richmondensis BFW]|nr:MAG: hypothetical protein FE78DRAFT_345103 [Acidomyces sp. 'richmondensis']KYG50078.1 hypothetical protein M433DRAFT_182620 [Acidomyces richmondensis BFW]